MDTRRVCKKTGLEKILQGLPQVQGSPEPHHDQELPAKRDTCDLHVRIHCMLSRVILSRAQYDIMR